MGFHCGCGDRAGSLLELDKFDVDTRTIDDSRTLVDAPPTALNSPSKSNCGTARSSSRISSVRFISSMVASLPDSAMLRKASELEPIMLIGILDAQLPPLCFSGVTKGGPASC